MYISSMNNFHKIINDTGNEKSFAIFYYFQFSFSFSFILSLLSSLFFSLSFLFSISSEDLFSFFGSFSFSSIFFSFSSLILSESFSSNSSSGFTVKSISMVFSVTLLIFPSKNSLSKSSLTKLLPLTIDSISNFALLPSNERILIRFMPLILLSTFDINFSTLSYLSDTRDISNLYPFPLKESFHQLTQSLIISSPAFLDASAIAFFIPVILFILISAP